MWMAFPAYAQPDATCMEATELWVPSAVSRQKSVAKWNRPLTFEVFLRNRNSPSLVSVTRELDFVAQHSGLAIGSASETSLDLLISLALDIAASAPKPRELVEKYFTMIIPGGRAKFDSDVFARTVQNTIPKCTGVNLVINGNIERAFIMIQEDQPPDCLTVGFGEIFGLINIRSLYQRKSEHFSPAHVASAFRSLYSDAIKAGMSAQEVKERFGKVCK